MKSETPKDEILVRYLLDDLTEAEREEIEERFFTDDSFFEAMVALEDDLHYDYRQNRLNKRERDAFERKFLATPRDREKSAFAAALLEASAEIAEEKAAVSKQNAAYVPSRWQSIVNFFSFKNGFAMQLGLAAASILLMLGGAWLFYQNAQLRREMAGLQTERAAETQKQEQLIAEKQQEQAELNRRRQELEQQLSAEKQQREQNERRIAEIEAERSRLEREINEARRRINENPPNPVSPPRQPSALAFSLAPGLTRSGDGSRINLSPNIKTLRLSLLLAADAPEYQSYRVTLRNVDEGEIWAGAARKARGRVSIAIPAANLKRGDYEIALSGVSPSGETEEIANYNFSVLK